MSGFFTHIRYLIDRAGLMDQYPSRQKFFANRVIRLLGKTCAAQEIGATGVLLVAWVAMTEDASGYRRAVTFFNGQLMPIIGTDSEKSLIAARQRAIEAGWLAYEKGGKGRAGQYFVKIPEHAISLDDAPSDESHDNNGYANGQSNALQNLQDKRQSKESTSTGKVQDNRQPFLPIPSPTPPTPNKGDDSFNESRRLRDRFKTVLEWTPDGIKAWIRQHEKIPRDHATVGLIQQAAIEHKPNQDAFFCSVDRIMKGAK